MLTVYRHVEDIPKHLKIIMDVESAFFDADIDFKTPSIVSALYDIDGASPISNLFMLSRFGTRMSFMDLSTGCKAIILALSTNTAVVNTIEVAGLAFDYLLEHVSEGYILQTASRRVAATPKWPINYGGVICDNIDSLSREALR